jgi:hypothetical protein
VFQFLKKEIQLSATMTALIKEIISTLKSLSTSMDPPVKYIPKVFQKTRLLLLKQKLPEQSSLLQNMNHSPQMLMSMVKQRKKQLLLQKLLIDRNTVYLKDRIRVTKMIQ